MRKQVLWLLMIFGAECLVTIYFSFVGSTSFVALAAQQEQLIVLTAANKELKQELAVLQKSIQVFAASAFYKEVIAREQLHMARADEVIYFVS